MHPLVVATLAYFGLCFVGGILWGKKFLSLPMWTKGLIVTPLLAGMFYTVWWMQNEETKHEATFMDVCWASGVAHYPDDPKTKEACPGGAEPLLWVKKTKTVYWDLDSGFNTYLESHQEAVQWWNKELGWQQFVAAQDKSSADIVITQGDAAGTGAMSTSHRRSGDVIRATILVKRPGDIRQWMLEEQHELGHALGLAHDRSGIMSKSLDEPDGMKVWLLHKKDRNAIRALYEPVPPSRSASSPSSTE